MWLSLLRYHAQRTQSQTKIELILHHLFEFALVKGWRKIICTSKLCQFLFSSQINQGGFQSRSNTYLKNFSMSLLFKESWMLKRIKVIFLQFLYFQWMGVSKTFKEESVHRTWERLLGFSWISEVLLVHWHAFLTQAAYQVPQFHDFSVFLIVFGYPLALQNFKFYFFPNPCQIASSLHLPFVWVLPFVPYLPWLSFGKAFITSVRPYLILHKMSLRAFLGTAHGIPRA